jgi:hypothetical protein
MVMDKTTRRKLEGLNHLVHDSVHAAVGETEKVHSEFARYPYAILERITPIAMPVRVIEFVQSSITGLVYRSIRLGATVASTAAAVTLAALPDDKSEP